MHKRMICLGLALMCILSGCSKETDVVDNTVTTTTGVIHTTCSTTNVATTTTTQPTVFPSATDRDNTTLNTTNTATTTTDIHHTESSRVSSNATHTTTSSATVSGSQTNTVTFTATVRNNDKKQPVANVIVTVYTNNSTTPAGSDVTDKSGVVRLPLTKAANYRVVLDNLPTGYEGDTEYRFSTNTVNITLRKKAVQNETDHSGAQYDVGKTMTDFTLTDTEGESYRLSALLKEKKLVILDFWFATCEPCKMEFPYFEAAVQKYGDDMALLAINPIDSMKSIVSLRDQFNAKPDTDITFPMLQDTCKLYLGFDVTAYPTTVFIDENGQILDIHVGSYPSEAAFFAAIERYLY